MLQREGETETERKSGDAVPAAAATGVRRAGGARSDGRADGLALAAAVLDELEVALRTVASERPETRERASGE